MRFRLGLYTGAECHDGIFREGADVWTTKRSTLEECDVIY